MGARQKLAHAFTRYSLYLLYWYKSTGTDAAGGAGMNLFRNQLASSGIQSMYVGTYAHLLTNVPWSATWWAVSY